MCGERRNDSVWGMRNVCVKRMIVLEARRDDSVLGDEECLCREKE